MSGQFFKKKSSGKEKKKAQKSLKSDYCTLFSSGERGRGLCLELFFFFFNEKTVELLMEYSAWIISQVIN